MTPSREPVIVVATIMSEEGTAGVQTHFNALRRHLEARHRPSMLVTPFDAPKALVYPLFAVRKLVDPWSGRASVWWYRHWHEFFLRMALRRRLPETANCIVYAQCPLSVQAALAARRHPHQKIVMVVHFNGSQADEWCDMGKMRRDGAPARRIRALEARILPSLDGIVYVSRYMKRELESRIPPLKCVPNAVIPNFCRPPAETAEVHEPVDIITVGTLEPRKNQQFLLQVLAYAMRRGKRYTLSVLGDGKDRRKLERLAHDLGIRAQVRFHGHRPHAIQWMKSARLYAHAATLENLPLALIEAMACGLPILAPAVGGIPDLFENGEAGYFWPLDDVPQAGDLLIRLLENADDLARAARFAKARFDERYESGRVADRLYAFIVRCAGERKPSALSHAETA